jgi:hypothetical protein
LDRLQQPALPLAMTGENGILINFRISELSLDDGAKSAL